MKILMVNDYKETIGGAELNMYMIGAELELRGNEVRYYSSNATKRQYEVSISNLSISKLILQIFNPISYIKFKKYLKSYQPDIIHLHGIFNELSPSILLACKNIPSVMTVHNFQIINRSNQKNIDFDFNMGYKSMIYEFIKARVHKKLLKGVSLFISPSKYLYNLLKKEGINPVMHIPNGINLLEYSKISNYKKILYVGRLSREKGLRFLLHAIPLIKIKINDIKLDIVGSGKEMNNILNEVRKLNIIENVRILGSVPNKNIVKYYHDASLVIVPSIEEDNFPTVCIEALSSGRPVIGTNVGGIPEIVKNGAYGYIVPIRDSEAIAKKVIRLINNKDLLDEMSNKSKTISQKYSLKKNVDILEKIYISKML